MEHTRGTLGPQILERAARDPEFRQRLKEHPKQTIEQEYGLTLPEGVDLRVLEDTPQTIYVVLPPTVTQRGQELSTAELEAVAGGWSGWTEACRCDTANGCNTGYSVCVECPARG